MKQAVVLLALAALACAQTPATPQGGNINANDFEHSYQISANMNMFWDETDPNVIRACVEAQATGYISIGWDSVSDVIMGVAPGGTVAVVDSTGHRNRPQADNQMTNPNKAGSNNGINGGWMTMCFERTWAGTGNNVDIVHDGSRNVNIKYAMSNAQTNDNQLNGLENQQHSSDGTTSVNLQDPANPIVNVGTGGGNNDSETTGGGGGDGLTIGLVVGGIVVAAAGVWYYQKNNAAGGSGGPSKGSYGGHGGPQSSGYGGPPGPGYGGPPGPGYGGPPGSYAGPGTYGSGNSHGSRSRSRSGGSGGNRSGGSRGGSRSHGSRGGNRSRGSRGSSGGRSNGRRGSRGRASNR